MKLTTYFYCEKCDFDLNMEHDEALAFLCNEGGYVISDKCGGYYSKCPKCEEENTLNMEW